MVFGKEVKGYDFPVLNERDARAGAGIMLIGGIAAFVAALYAFSISIEKILPPNACITCAARLEYTLV